MCGIFGAVRFDGASLAGIAAGGGLGIEVSTTPSVDADLALAAIAHRGPDARAIWRGAGAVLGHTRLAIIDLTPSGTQPMLDREGQAVVVFNGEIYNHHELRSELAALGYRFRGRSDTEVIVEGYRAWGEGVIERLDGMFALGLWDTRKQKLLLARDRTGKKPLFYAERAGTIFFGSEIKALTAAGVREEMDVSSLPWMLSFGYAPAPRTMFAGVSQLPPASLMTFEEGRPSEPRRYWRAPFAAEPLHVSSKEATGEVRRLVENAVRRRLEADVPLGAFLSGGVDSTVIVGVMSRLLGRRVKTFSIGFAGDARFDETSYARLAARTFDTEHVEFTLKPSSFDLVERLVELHDGPFGDSSAIPTSVVSMLTRRHVTVALTGDGGDELFCGYLRFLAAEAAEQVPQFLRNAGARLADKIGGTGHQANFLTRAQRFLGAAALPLADRLTRWAGLYAFELDDILLPDLRASLDTAAPLAWMRQVVEQSRGARTMARVLDHNFETYLPYDLLVKADRASMAHGLEVRSPFLDTALIEYAARLPDAYKRRGPITKWILRRAFKDLLPPEIYRRGKWGFGVPLGTWFRGDLRSYLQDHLSPQALLWNYLDRNFAATLLREHMQGRADHGHRLWLLLTLEIWLRALKSRQAN